MSRRLGSAGSSIGKSYLAFSSNPASREELMNAMLHFFLGSGVDEEEIGDLSLEKMPIPQLHRFGLAENGPVPVFTRKSKYAALIVNLGILGSPRV